MGNPAEVKHEYNLETTNKLPAEKFDAIVLTVVHKRFLEMGFNSLKNENAVVYGVKGILGENCNGKL